MNHVHQVDATKDIKGTFYAPGEWAEKYDKLREALEAKLKTSLRRQSNSFNSCFQYIEKASAERPYRRIKVYNKLLALFQSVSPSKSIGMNTNGIFAPSM